MSNEDFLPIAEDFYSVQGEGLTTGYPAYFIRLMHCNLTCGASTALVNQFRKGERNDDPAGFKGDLHESGEATWTCDTIPVWTKGHKKPLDYLIDRWIDQDIIGWVNSGRVNLIWTGGEPTMPKSQKAITTFLDYHKEIYPDATLYNEIETNGTFYIEDKLFNEIDQINCSVKLANSGMPKKRRIKPEALERIMEHDNYWFKFVISYEEDMYEIHNDFIKPFNIDPKRICMMPGLDSQKDFHERTKFVMEMAIKYGYIGLSRMHISAWDQATGV